MIHRPGPAALVAFVLIMVLALGCALLAEAALPFTVGAQETISATRIDAQTAELCAPSGPIFERNGQSEYLQVIDAWPGGCGVINVRDRFGGYVYCTAALACSAPLEAWRGRELWLPMIAR